jgi:16S rRNA (adenine1518-N6/adenine1519-N6)-dimethyltransferase
MAERIVRASGVEAADAVIEIGPGLGALTERLVSRVRRLLAIEIDRGLVQALREQPFCAQLELLHADVLETDLVALGRAQGPPVVLLGNLPYAIAGRLLGGLLLAPNPFRRWVFMLQSEVGDRLRASAGTSEYGPLAVYAALCVRVSRVLELGPEEFVPRPRVRSSLLVFEPLSPAPSIADPAALRTLVRHIFQHRRKTLHRVLRDLIADPQPLLDLLGIDPKCRGETLEPLAFVRMADALLALPGGKLTPARART